MLVVGSGVALTLHVLETGGVADEWALHDLEHFMKKHKVLLVLLQPFELFLRGLERLFDAATGSPVHVFVEGRRLVADGGAHAHDALDEVEVLDCSHVVVDVVAGIFHEGCSPVAGFEFGPSHFKYNY